jgi:hypothetical protein
MKAAIFFTMLFMVVGAWAQFDAEGTYERRMERRYERSDLYKAVEAFEKDPGVLAFVKNVEAQNGVVCGKGKASATRGYGIQNASYSTKCSNKTISIKVKVRAHFSGDMDHLQFKIKMAKVKTSFK